MAVFLKIIEIAAIVLAALFVLTLPMYMFNWDMKLAAKLTPLFDKHYDKMKRNTKI